MIEIERINVHYCYVFLYQFRKKKESHSKFYFQSSIGDEKHVYDYMLKIEVPKTHTHNSS